jgi:hypothetical protein
MSVLVLRSINHLYKLFKVYLTLAILGAFAVVVYQLLLHKPLISILLILLLSITCLLTMVFRVSPLPMSFGRGKRVVDDVLKK